MIYSDLCLRASGDPDRELEPDLDCDVLLHDNLIIVPLLLRESARPMACIEKQLSTTLLLYVKSHHSNSVVKGCGIATLANHPYFGQPCTEAVVVHRGQKEQYL